MAKVQVQVWRSVQPGHVQTADLTLPACATVADAIALLGWPETAGCGIWGRACTLDTVLTSGDRVELYRALTVDPKVARRERFAQQGARGAGLFSARRPHSKAGY
ncbi:MAG: RnfH family protein [Comamonas sp.]|jgi:uncharacterized protein|uniref:UPF0125 protein J1777_11990 n=1 Tax=Comamonas denitrificans TaxID=117506 RepID=A0A939H288_9BURK|nr:RnfH family protein [Comamonas denitrificans]MBP6042622.1 RnfH family protein [Comamonas sp.]MBO1250538.1 RnfH family protein [Comamonas denitrificans]MBP6292887.1 RnfH family protein [Comamonas sp.]MBP7840849.1 RnfH family protein [Comamonas sp.]MBP7855094.1 RnfH family protein [Comamonas sp.]